MSNQVPNINETRAGRKLPNGDGQVRIIAYSGFFCLLTYIKERENE